MKKFFVATIFCIVIPCTYGMTTQKPTIKERVISVSNDTVQFEGLLGTFDSKIINAVKILRIAQNNTVKAKSLMLPGYNIILLHGPCGNGKTTLPRKMAQAAEAIYLELPGPSILDPYIGGGEKSIHEMFEKIESMTDLGETVVLFIDETDAIAAKSTRKDDNRSYLSMRQALGIHLDTIKKNPRVLVIGATNNFQDFDLPLRDRFRPIEIKNPNENLRLQILTHYWGEYLSSFPYNKGTLKQIAQQSEGLSIRALENSISALASNALAEDLSTISEKSIWEEFNASKAKTLGTRISRIKESASNVSTVLQTHIYPHISAIGSVATTVLACFQLKNFFSPQSVQKDTAKTTNGVAQEIQLSPVDINSLESTAAAA